MSITFLVLGRGGFSFFLGGGLGKADFIFMGARIFLNDSKLQMQTQEPCN